MSGTRRLIGATAGLAVWLMAGTATLACPICFQFEENAATDGVMAAVVVLVGVTAGVLGGFARFIVRFVRRTRSLEQ